jgi:hypothetical protein
MQEDVREEIWEARHLLNVSSYLVVCARRTRQKEKNAVRPSRPPPKSTYIEPWALYSVNAKAGPTVLSQRIVHLSRSSHFVRSFESQNRVTRRVGKPLDQPNEFINSLLCLSTSSCKSFLGCSSQVATFSEAGVPRHQNQGIIAQCPCPIFSVHPDTYLAYLFGLSSIDAVMASSSWNKSGRSM